MRGFALFLVLVSFIALLNGRVVDFTTTLNNLSLPLVDGLDKFDEPVGTDDAHDFYPPVPASGLDWDPAVLANDELWKEYVDKGEHNLCLMRATDEGAAALITDNPTPNTAKSPFRGNLKNALKRWGWNQRAYETWWECDFDRQEMTATFEGLGINPYPAVDDEEQPTDDGHNECFSIVHYNPSQFVDPDSPYPVMTPVTEQQYQVDGNWKRATGAYFEFAVNKVDGAIFGRTLNSPTHAVLDDKTSWGRAASPGELPELRHASDIFWGYWYRDNPNYRNLRYYGANTVINEHTVLLAARALHNAGETLSGWPGATFATDTDEGKALIASPIGNTIVNLLVRRKAELGIKYITKVTIVSTDNPKKKGPGSLKDVLHVIFHIEDYQEEEELGIEVKVEAEGPGKREIVDDDMNATPEMAYTDWTPATPCSNELWNRYIAKGNRFSCLFPLSDQDAGVAIGDARQPPSARSAWPRDLNGKWYRRLH
ncbi:hypothetical protein P153DRAFT_285911 [Dothidotthia symphoricarpi CBS 119687]|uniref:Uncharacterized protein n=1 Tax=Dothidotthia symphoricarpi CBS 119687 TaxID=1392245 RepID=A0A6A6AIK1_9PLEO|nr:uncharacterized protein P153DRAFT_285911 [Dothidotthia symphoricarpi CBS 119687]KAF2131792.1 hypothetical protein P153DRAFT_285911 [Dothidotthia symphoricarpi CBS 119687]